MVTAFTGEKPYHNPLLDLKWTKKEQVQNAIFFVTDMASNLIKEDTFYCADQSVGPYVAVFSTIGTFQKYIQYYRHGHAYSFNWANVFDKQFEYLEKILTMEYWE